MDSFLERLKIEEEELGEKIVKLNAALNSDNFAQKVGNYQFDLLFFLHSTMVNYRKILRTRIEDLTNKKEDNNNG